MREEIKEFNKLHNEFISEHYKELSEQGKEVFTSFAEVAKQVFTRNQDLNTFLMILGTNEGREMLSYISTDAGKEAIKQMEKLKNLNR